MAKVFVSPACDPAQLSAFRDDALDPPKRRWLERHLDVCPACRHELMRLERLAAGLDTLAVNLAYRPTLGEIVNQRAGGHRPPRPGRRALAAATAALTILLLIVLTAERPLTSPAVRAFPAIGASGVSTDTAITIAFAYPVDETTVQATLRVDPSTPFDLTWESAQHLTIIPLTPLAARTTYTVQAAVRRASPADSTPEGAAAPTMILAQFATASGPAAPGGPTPRIDALNGGLPIASAHAMLGALPTPSPAPLRELGPQPVTMPGTVGTMRRIGSGASLPACAPTGAFAPVYANRPDVRAALGCAEGAAAPITAETQLFQHGILMAAYPDDLLFQFTGDGLWRAETLTVVAVPSTPLTGDLAHVGPTFRRYWSLHPSMTSILGSPIGPEQAFRGARQRFASGFMLTTSEGTYLADDAGQWQRLTPETGGSGGVGATIVGGVPSFIPMRAPGLSGAPLIAAPEIEALPSGVEARSNARTGAR